MNTIAKTFLSLALLHGLFGLRLTADALPAPAEVAPAESTPETVKVPVPVENGTAAEPLPAEPLVVADAPDAEPAAPAPIPTSQPEPPQVPTESAEDREMATLRKELQLLTLQRDRVLIENSLRKEMLQRELAPIHENRERLAASYLAEKENLTQQLANTRLEAEKLALETDVIQKRLAFLDALRKLEVAEATAAQETENALLRVTNALANEKANTLIVDFKTKEAELKSQKITEDYALMQLDSRIRMHDRSTYVDRLAPRERIVYAENPHEDGRLTISDRRIALNGAITYESAEFVATRINFYNNLDGEKPIFIVIDYSPGGSVMAGYHILKAMEGSQAPVYVVVKSFAASMAATIATLAEKSFAYPNAIILHHQMSYGLRGNMTQQTEALRESQEWFNRLAIPIAQKMGITIEEFVRTMYEKNSDGDWKEFADVAQKLKWIDHVVTVIHETSLLRDPDMRPPAIAASAPATSLLETGGTSSDAGLFFTEPDTRWSERELVDERGRRFVRLPRLVSHDVYFLYDRDNYYRID